MPTHRAPARRQAAGFTWIELLLVKEVNVNDGAITLTFGNNASKALEGKRLTLRPAVMEGEPMVPIAWVCHALPAPKGMEIRGTNETDIPPGHLPIECRGAPAK